MNQQCIVAALYPFNTTGSIPRGRPLLVKPCLLDHKSVANCPLPCTSYGSFKLFKISTSDFRTVGMHRQKRACTDEFLAMVTEGVVHSVYKVVTWWSFGVIWQEKANGGKWMFHHCVTRSHTNLGR